jgi:hypothetical protein
VSTTLSLDGENVVIPTASDTSWDRNLNAALRTIVSRLDQTAQVVNVNSYGLEGDGTTDDLAAIQEAVNDATPGTVLKFAKPASQYKVTGPIDLSSKVGVILEFTPGSATDFNIKNTGAGPAILFAGSQYCAVRYASIKNTDTAAGVGIKLTALSYEIDIEHCHVTDGLAGYQVGTTSGGNCFNLFFNRCTAKSTANTPITLTYGFLFYAAVNVFLKQTYVHGCTTAYKRIVPTGGPTADQKKFDNIHMFHPIAEYCGTFGFDFDQSYAITLERPYVEEWGRDDATPTSHAINLSGLSFTDIAVDARSVTFKIIDPLFFGEGSQAGAGKLVKVAKYFHVLEYTNATSSPARTTHLTLDDGDGTDRGERAGRPLVILQGREYGVITCTDSQAIFYERAISGANQNLDTVSVGSKADVGTGVVRGSVGETVTSSRKFAHRSYAVRGSAHMAQVVDTDGIYDTRFSAASPNNSYDDNRFFGRRMNATTDGFFARSLQNDVMFDVSMGTGFAKVQCTKEDATSTKLLKLNTDGGGVQVGGVYDNPLRLGTYYLWVSSGGKLYIKSSAPSTDTDGTIVGTQT